MSNVPPDLSYVFDKNVRDKYGRPYRKKVDKEEAEVRGKSLEERRYKKFFDPYTGQESLIPRETTNLYDDEGNLINENIDYVNQPADFGAFPPDFVRIPTNTTAYDANASKPGQPRTVAAVYDPVEQRLTVMFLDKTLYNYEGVTMTEWTTFRDHRSPGEYIFYTLNQKERGRADDSSFTEDDLAKAHMIATTAQRRIARQGGWKPKAKTTRTVTKKKPASFKPAPVWNPNKFGELK